MKHPTVAVIIALFTAACALEKGQGVITPKIPAGERHHDNNAQTPSAVNGTCDPKPYVQPLLTTHCVKCHTKSSGVGIAADQAGTWSKSDWLLAADAIIQRRMPPAGNTKISEADIAQLTSCRSLATSGPAVNVSESETLLLASSDYNTLSTGSKQDTRYLSLAHLGGTSDAELDIMRFGITKMLNSLSLKPTIVPLRPVDQQKTLFRVKLSEYGWDAETWNLLKRDKYATQNLQTLPGGAAVAKGDWFVFAGSRPEIYDLVLQLPQLEQFLETRLKIDRRRDKPVYLGVNSSVVARAGRLLERIPIDIGGKPGGYYWRSYDFLFSNKAERFLKDQFIPDFVNGRSTTRLIAGEFIFSLPNGLQAYMLSGFGRQHRYDADSRVAHDTRRKDQLVINGESCFACHGNGLNKRIDEVRPIFTNNPARFSQSTLQQLDDLYSEDIYRYFDQDNTRYLTALQELGFPQIKVEPINATISRFKTNRGIQDVRTQRGEIDAVLGRK
jgi:hypothetical protein